MHYLLQNMFLMHCDPCEDYVIPCGPKTGVGVLKCLWIYNEKGYICFDCYTWLYTQWSEGIISKNVYETAQNTCYQICSSW